MTFLGCVTVPQQSEVDDNILLNRSYSQVGNWVQD